MSKGIPQLSEAVGVIHEGVAEHSIVEAAGNGEMTGGVLSSTVIVCDAVAVLPQASVAVHVRVTDDSLAHVPGVVTSANVKTGEPQLSEADGVVQVGEVAHSIVEGAGRGEITGGKLSSVLEIVCVHVAVLPHPSAA